MVEDVLGLDFVFEGYSEGYLRMKNEVREEEIVVDVVNFLEEEDFLCGFVEVVKESGNEGIVKLV